MKKSILLTLILITTITSCNSTTFSIERKDTDNYVILDEEAFNNKIDEKIDLITEVYVKGCSSCLQVTDYLKSYAQDKKVILYAITLDDFQNSNVPYAGEKLKKAPAIVFFKKGELKDIKTQNLTDSKYLYHLLDSKINI